jgi:hypothetical protein
MRAASLFIIIAALIEACSVSFISVRVSGPVPDLRACTSHHSEYALWKSPLLGAAHDNEAGGPVCVLIAPPRPSEAKP